MDSVPVYFRGPGCPHISIAKARTRNIFPVTKDKVRVAGMRIRGVRSLGPGEIAFLRQILDAAWKEIEGHYIHDADGGRAAKERLAMIILALSKCGSLLDPGKLKSAAIEQMTLPEF